MTQNSTDLSDLRMQLWQRLILSSRAIEEELRRRMRQQFDSTLPRFDVLSVLNTHPDGLKMSEISSQLGVSNGNVTGIIDKLTADGAVRRVPMPGDRRAFRVQLLPQGQAAYAAQSKAYAAWINDMLGDLNGDDLDGMNLRLDRLADALAPDSDEHPKANKEPA